MPARTRYLGGRQFPPPPPPSSAPPSNDSSSSAPVETTLDSDFVVILAALLCALICVLGLAAVARCAWIRRISGRNAASSSSSQSAAATRSANKGLKKKVLKSLPKVTYDEEQLPEKLSSECAICLSEFSAGDEIRILPQCGHGFHVVCIDTWLGSHSSCPSCRQILVVARCQKCGNLPSPAPEGAGGGQQLSNTPTVNRFLP